MSTSVIREIPALGSFISFYTGEPDKRKQLIRFNPLNPCIFECQWPEEKSILNLTKFFYSDTEDHNFFDTPGSTINEKFFNFIASKGRKEILIAATYFIPAHNPYAVRNNSCSPSSFLSSSPKCPKLDNLNFIVAYWCLEIGKAVKFLNSTCPITFNVIKTERVKFFHLNGFLTEVQKMVYPYSTSEAAKNSSVSFTFRLRPSHFPFSNEMKGKYTGNGYYEIARCHFQKQIEKNSYQFISIDLNSIGKMAPEVQDLKLDINKLQGCPLQAAAVIYAMKAKNFTKIT